MKRIYWFCILFFSLVANAHEWSVKMRIAHNRPLRQAKMVDSRTMLLSGYPFDEEQETRVALRRIDDDQAPTVLLPHFCGWNPVIRKNYIVTAPNENTMALWDINGNKQATYQGVNFNKIKVAAKGDLLVTFNIVNYALTLLDVAYNKPIASCYSDNGCVKTMKFFPQDERIIFIPYFGYRAAKIWDTRSKRLIKRHDLERLQKVSIHPEGNYITALAEDPNVIDLHDLRKEGVFSHLSEPYHPSSATFNTDGTYILGHSGRGEEAALWDMKTVTATVAQGVKYFSKNYKERIHHVRNAQFHPEGQNVVTAISHYGRWGRRYYKISLWDLKGQELTQLHCDDEIFSAQYEKTGNYIVSRHEGNKVCIWEKK